MVSEELKPIEKAKYCIVNNINFIFKGGAGSGKTQSLKDLVSFIAEKHPEKKIICITHTNKAVEEIQDRVKDSRANISTIHSFLHSIIKNYKKNIHEVIFELFKLDKVENEDYSEYKKIYGKYADKLYSIEKTKTDIVIGKRVYDANKTEYNNVLNNEIEKLNNIIHSKINEKDFNDIKYNETKFNSFKDLTYGHDGLLELAIIMFKKYPRLQKILQDKADCIFIDEYQDAKKEVIEIFSNLPQQNKITIGLFGDLIQSIYQKESEIFSDDSFELIPKKDNYRCSYEVIDFINTIRTDGLEQKVAFKKKKDSEDLETEADRHGEVKFYYKVVSNKPNSRSLPEEKDAYLTEINRLIDIYAGELGSNFKILKLTNKSIAQDAGFGNLFEIFDWISLEPVETLEKHLRRLQLEELCALCDAYNKKNYNCVLSSLKKQNLGIKKLEDKRILRDNFEDILTSHRSIMETLNTAFEYGLIKQSEKFDEYQNRKNTFLSELEQDPEYQEFKTLYELEGNRYPQIKDLISIADFTEEDFDELKHKYSYEKFYNVLFLGNLLVDEVLNYYQYLREEKNFVTMHKTKGTGIDNVLIVLDEYFWNRYNFKSIYMDDADPIVKQVNTNLFYVACSRAIKNLTCIKLITEDEKDSFLEKFGNVAIEIPT